MKQQKKETWQDQKRMNEARMLELACRQREEQVGDVIAAGYRRGVRRVNRRHVLASIVVYLCLASATVGIMGWLCPYQMSAGSRAARLAAYNSTQQMLARQ